jgi:hypothetical protein
MAAHIQQHMQRVPQSVRIRHQQSEAAAADVEDVGMEPIPGRLSGRQLPELNRPHAAHRMARLAAAIETLARLIPQGLIQRWERPGHGLNARQRAGARATLRFRSNSNLEGPGSSA